MGQDWACTWAMIGLGLGPWLGLELGHDWAWTWALILGLGQPQTSSITCPKQLQGRPGRPQGPQLVQNIKWKTNSNSRQASGPFCILTFWMPKWAPIWVIFTNPESLRCPLQTLWRTQIQPRSLRHSNLAIFQNYQNRKISKFPNLNSFSSKASFSFFFTWNHSKQLS